MVGTPCWSYPGDVREWQTWLPADGKSWCPVMGRNAHIIFREFQEVFGSRHPAVDTKEALCGAHTLLLCPGP